jgi:hypothetical protein
MKGHIAHLAGVNLMMKKTKMVSDEAKENVKEAFANRDYWDDFAPDGWTLGGFTYRESAIFHKIENGRYVLTANFESNQLEFIQDLLETRSNK